MKLISFILAFYVLVCAVVPCCADDDCMAQTATQEKNDCKAGCSPFFACGNCCGFSINAQQIAVMPVTVFEKISYSEFYISTQSDYYQSFWQPPRFS